MTTEIADVTIAGAGPVGLLLGGELRLAGVSVTVLERLTEQAGGIKAGGLNGRSTQLLNRRGLRDALSAESQRHGAGFATFARGGANGSTGFGGHFGGLLLHAGPGLDVPPSTVLPQQALERLLRDRAVALGADVRRGHEVAEVTPDEDGVTVLVRTAAGPVTVRSRYLVGCDGGRSDVRKLTGFAFPGTDPITTGYQAVVTLARPEQLPLGWHLTPTGLYAHGPATGRLLLVSFQGPPAGRSVDVPADELAAALRHVTGTDVDLAEVHATTRFTDHTRQAATYRDRRILLAGDAAHVHPPFGGQGLNLGLQDAANLGWKLAATVRGWAPAGLLDTYEAERHPIAARVLSNTRAQLSIMRPDPHSRAMRELFAGLLPLPGVTEQLVSELQGLDITYDMGVTGHPLIGRHLNDRPGLDEAMCAGHPVLTGSPALGDLIEGWEDRVRFLPARSADGSGAALVRPDGYVAWAAGPEPEPAELESLSHALGRWFGDPRATR
jgi:2-polyprenyl-6-methoxyphenol hydroxylase-like FAD-dependent oxidoreductase